jgi:hypothetical protein
MVKSPAVAAATRWQPGASGVKRTCTKVGEQAAMNDTDGNAGKDANTNDKNYTC